MRTAVVSSLAAAVISLTALTAHADDAWNYSVHGHAIVIDGAEHVEVPADCMRVFAISKRDEVLRVACGVEGVLIYWLRTPTTPVLAGRYPVAGSCEALDLDGACHIPDATLVERPPADNHPVEFAGSGHRSRPSSRRSSPAKDASVIAGGVVLALAAGALTVSVVVAAASWKGFGGGYR